MQDFRDEKKTIKNHCQSDFIPAKFVMGYPCVSPHVLFYMHGPIILLCFLSYVNITKLLKFKIATKRPF